MSTTRRGASLLASGGRIYVDRRRGQWAAALVALVALAGVVALAAVLLAVRW